MRWSSWRSFAFAALGAAGLVAGCAREPSRPLETSAPVASLAPSATGAVSIAGIPWAPDVSPSAPQAASASPAPGRPRVRYLALGDSFTIGTGSSPDQSFPSRVAGRMREAGNEVVLENLGVNGFTTDDLISAELPRVKAFAPTVVTLAVGANDIVHGSSEPRYRSQIKRIFAALAAAGVPGKSIVVLPQPNWSLSPVAASFGRPADIEKSIVAFNSILREEATAARARYIDLYPLMRMQAQEHLLADDGLHPSADAYKAWAEVLTYEADL